MRNLSLYFSISDDPDKHGPWELSFVFLQKTLERYHFETKILLNSFNRLISNTFKSYLNKVYNLFRVFLQDFIIEILYSDLDLGV